MSGNNDSVKFIDNVLISNEVLNLLKDLNFSNSGIKRLCLHESLQSDLHFMIIESKPNNSFSIHSHSDSDEIINILCGELKIEIFETNSSNPIIYNLNILSNKSLLIRKNLYHRVTSLNNGAIFTEIKLGPFNPSSINFI
jgi:cupin fold WbuC family metalloprotein